MPVTAILVVVAAAARPVYVAVLSLPVIVAAAQIMLVAVLVLRLGHVAVSPRRGVVPPPAPRVLIAATGSFERPEVTTFRTPEALALGALGSP